MKYASISLAIFIASSRVGLYLSFSIAIIVCQLTPNLFAISSCRNPASFLSFFTTFLITVLRFHQKICADRKQNGNNRNNANDSPNNFVRFRGILHRQQSFFFSLPFVKSLEYIPLSKQSTPEMCYTLRHLQEPASSRKMSKLDKIKSVTFVADFFRAQLNVPVHFRPIFS